MPAFLHPPAKLAALHLAAGIVKCEVKEVRPVLCPTLTYLNYQTQVNEWLSVMEALPSVYGFPFCSHCLLTPPKKKLPFAKPRCVLHNFRIQTFALANIRDLLWKKTREACVLHSFQNLSKLLTASEIFVWCVAMVVVEKTLQSASAWLVLGIKTKAGKFVLLAVSLMAYFTQLVCGWIRTWIFLLKRKCLHFLCHSRSLKL